MSSNSRKVSIFHRINKLRLKAGIPLNADIEGYIDPEGVERAQSRINESEKHYEKEIEEVLVKLESAWEDFQAQNELQRKKWANKIFNFANNIKDLASTYDYDLMAYFGKSLRDICERIDLEKDEHKVIVNAHINVMWACFEHKMKGEGGPQAQELKQLVQKAIEQNI